MSMRATACANVAEVVQVPKTGLGPCYFTFRQGRLAGPLVADGKSWPAPTESSGHSIKLPGNWSRNRGRIGLEIGAAGARQRKRKGPAAAAPGRRWWRSGPSLGPEAPERRARRLVAGWRRPGGCPPGPLTGAARRAPPPSTGRMCRKCGARASRSLTVAGSDGCGAPFPPGGPPARRARSARGSSPRHRLPPNRRGNTRR